MNEEFEKMYHDQHPEGKGKENNPDKVRVNHIHIPECLTVERVEAAYSDFCSLRDHIKGFEIEFHFDYDMPVILKGILSDTRFDIDPLNLKKVNLEKLQNQYNQYFDEWVNSMKPTWFGAGTKEVIELSDDNQSFFGISDFYNEETEIIWQTYNNEPVDLGIELDGAPFKAWKEIVKKESIIESTLNKLSNVMMEIEGNIFEVEKQLGFLSVEIVSHPSLNNNLNKYKTKLSLKNKYEDFTRHFFKTFKGRDKHQLMKDEDVEIFIKQNFDKNYLNEFKKFTLDCNLNLIYDYAISLSNNFIDDKKGSGHLIVDLLFDNFTNFEDHKNKYVGQIARTNFYSNHISSKAKGTNTESSSFKSKNEHFKLK